MKLTEKQKLAILLAKKSEILEKFSKSKKKK
jgi:hypothetical protein